MAQTPPVQPDNRPIWCEGKTINEAAFCQAFLAQHRLAHTENAFFTPEGRVTDVTLLKEQIFRMLEPYATTSVTKKISNIIELLKITANTDQLLPQTDRIHLANGTLYRLPVGPDVILPLLPDSSLSPLYYSIHLFHPDGTCAFRRSYHPVPSHFFRHTLLLQNKYGLLSAFSPMSVAAATVVEGDKYRLQHRLGFSISSASQLFTATSQMLRRSEAAALSASLAAPHAFARVGSQWLPIAIVPDSFTAFDESQDLVQLSFSFYFVLDQLDNLAVPLSDNISHAILLTEDGFALTQENNAPLSI